MEHTCKLHIIDSDTRNRAALARTGFAIGRHCEVYSDVEEFLLRPPVEGSVFLVEQEANPGVAELLAGLAKIGSWLPIAVLTDEPDAQKAVAAMHAGALDYRRLLIDADEMRAVVTRLESDGAARGRAQRNMVAARSRIGALSQREREVLECLAQGGSNKVIARELEISPRTVEIHRANMLVKLGAAHSAQAIRMQVEAQLDPVIAMIGPVWTSQSSGSAAPMMALVG